MSDDRPTDHDRADENLQQRKRDGCLLMLVAAAFFFLAVGCGVFGDAPELTIICFVASFVIYVWAMLKRGTSAA